jgi:hypothetical protein
MGRRSLASSFEARWILRSPGALWVGALRWTLPQVSRRPFAFFALSKSKRSAWSLRWGAVSGVSVRMAATTWSVGHLNRRIIRTALDPGHCHMHSTSVKYFTGCAPIRSTLFGEPGGLITPLKKRCPRPRKPNPVSASWSPCTIPALSPPGPNACRFWGNGRIYPP